MSCRWEMQAGGRSDRTVDRSPWRCHGRSPGRQDRQIRPAHGNVQIVMRFLGSIRRFALYMIASDDRESKFRHASARERMIEGFGSLNEQMVMKGKGLWQ